MRKLLFIVFALVIASNSWAELSITKDDATGIVTITQTSAGELGPALRDHAQNPSISDEDYEKITSASGFVLYGPFAEDPDLAQLAAKNSSITSLDLSNCEIFSYNMQYFKIPDAWKETLTSIDIPTDDSFSFLPENFLYGFQGITQIIIPANITEIRNGALGDLSLTEITIPATVELIKEGAFKDMTSLKDVYAESRNTVCEMNAFDFEALVGQTDIAHIYTYAAKLHYPDTPDDYEYFVGAWKEGTSIANQHDLNGFKDGFYTEPGHVKVGPNNGWQQFAISDRSEPYLFENGAIRTYSDSYEHDKLPTGKEYEVKVYRATGYDDDGNVIMRRVYGSEINKPGKKEYYNCIPANTGVVLVAYSKHNNPFLYYYAKTTEGIKQYPWKWNDSNETDNSGTNNLLEKSIEPTEVHPVWPWPKTTVEYRNFGLIKVGNVYKWSRLTSSTMRANRAYLKMPASVFTNNNEGAEEGPGNEGLGNAKAFTMFDNGGQVLSVQGADDDEIQYVGISFPDDEPTYDDGYQSEMCFLYAYPEGDIAQSGVATRIETVSYQNQDDYYYNLQGVRVQPKNKGVYIHKGKKIVIK